MTTRPGDGNRSGVPVEAVLPEGIRFYAARLAHVGLTFAVAVLLARLLGPDGKGAVQLLWLVPQLAAAVLILGLHQANVYLLGVDREGGVTREPQLLWNGLYACAVLGAAGAVAIAVGRLPLARVLGLGAEASALGLAAVLIPLTMLWTIALHFLLGRLAFRERNLLEVTTTALLAVATAVLVWGARLGAGGAVVARIVALAIALLLAAWWLGRSGLRMRPVPPVPRLLRAALGYGMRSQAGNVLQMMNLRLDMLFVGGFLGTTEVGIYSVAVAVGELLWFLPTAMGSVLFPTIAGRDMERSSGVASRACRQALLLTGLGAAAMAIAGRWLLPLVFGGAFADAWIPLLVLLPGIVALAFHRVLIFALMSWGRPQEMSYAALLALVVTIVLDLLLIPRWGILGAAAASTLAYATCGGYTAIRFLHVTGTAWTSICVPRRADLCELWDHAVDSVRGAARGLRGGGAR
ncbi:MAG: oligosaccharide flippase family protein [Candidatus Bipolaricaulota bacterium]|nr:MAG: oligosaccharide flippase family protein [Candidatus Bipolaricaulota bacterium]